MWLSSIFYSEGENNFEKSSRLPAAFCYSLIMEMTIDPKEFAAEDLAAYAAEYEAWLDELEAIVMEYGNPNIWID
jgi:hypothetical protein